MILHPNIPYRSDIDGLRALAVLSVIIFHIDKNLIPGGFLGVDIFFVISGYLITLILTKEIGKTNAISITNFYKRRIKRIAPALLFVLTVTFIAGLFLFAPDDLLALSKSMVWSLFSAANIYFYSSIDTGYFADDSTVLPFLNLWSLGVEEQFYIIWPFLVLFLLKYVVSKKKRIFVASALFMGSFVWAQAIIINNQSFAYYMLPTRSWELLSGSIIALLMHSGFRIKNVVNELMALIGFLAIVLSLIFVSESSPVPGIGAIPAVLGSSFIILSGITHKTYISRFLSFKLLVAIGLISYSAYLWHWPILAFLRYAFIDIKGIVAVTVFLLTLGIATLSYFFIEIPLRTNNASTKNVYIWYFVVPVAVLVTLSLLTEQAINKNSESIFPWEKLHKSKDDMQAAFAYKYNCQYSLFDTKAYTEQRCVFPENIEKANAFLIGDSNAAHYLGMLRVFAEHYGFSIHNATQSSCPPIFEGEFDWINTKYQEGCAIYRSSVFGEAKKYDTVFVGGSWDFYFPKEGFKESFYEAVKLLSENVNHVVLLAKVPIFPAYNKDCEIRAVRIDSLDCETRFNNTLPENLSNRFLREIAKKYNNVVYFDIRDQLCNNGLCSPYLDERPVYFDGGHLSMKGSERLGKKMIVSQSNMLSGLKYLENQKQVYRTHVVVDNAENYLDFSIITRLENIKIAFYLYKNGERIATQWYGNNLFYRLDKQTAGKGRYKIRYFIVDKNNTNPGKVEKIESGYSQEIDV